MPTSIPARRSLLIGHTPTMNTYPGWTAEPRDLDRMHPCEMTAAGYQTRLIGKSPSTPDRNHWFFKVIRLTLMLHVFTQNDYALWHDERVDATGAEPAYGFGQNSRDPRHWHYFE
jgi:hypothetical protein